MATVGEPIEPETWRWYYDVVGKGRAAIVDTWWQTETGGHALFDPARGRRDEAGEHRTRPTGHLSPSILDDHGEEVPKGSGRAGNIVLRPRGRG